MSELKMSGQSYTPASPMRALQRLSINYKHHLTEAAAVCCIAAAVIALLCGDRQQAARAANVHRTFERFIAHAHRAPVTVTRPDFYLRDAGRVVNAASGETCALLTGDQIQLLSYDDRTHNSLITVHPTAWAADYYSSRNRHDPEKLRADGVGKSCTSEYRARLGLDGILELWRMADQNDSLAGEYPYSSR